MGELNLVGPEDDGLRLDAWLARKVGVSRTLMQVMISGGAVRCVSSCVGSRVEKDVRVRTGEVFLVEKYDFTSKNLLVPYKGDLNVVYEDEDLLVVNKPPGLPVHAGIGTGDNTLVNMLVDYLGVGFAEMSDLRPGIVHRLDKDTTGLLLVAKNAISSSLLSSQVASGAVRRRYLALVWGSPINQKGCISCHLRRSRVNRSCMEVSKFGGKFAKTEYEVLERFRDSVASLLRCSLFTGRTHQIRVQFSSIGCSLIGDQKYGKNNKKVHSRGLSGFEVITSFSRQALFAAELSFYHPFLEKQLEFSAEPDVEMMRLINCFRSL